MKGNPFKSLDETRLNFFHFKNLFTTGMGVFTDGYDLSSIGIVLGLVLSSYGIKEGSSSYVLYDSLVAGSALVGAAIGALIFGQLSRMGRKKFYGIDVGLMTVGALLQALAPNAATLIAIRFLLGMGIGADYVLSPMIMAEHTNAKDRGKIIALGFGMFWGFGATTAAAITLVLSSIHISPDIIWRIVLAAGAIPAASVIYLRRKIPETARYLGRIKGDLEEMKEVIREITNSQNVNVDNDLKDNKTLRYYFRRNFRTFFGAMVLWFLFDIAAYSSILFGPTSIAKVLGLTPSLFQFVTEFAFTVPGGIMAILLIDRVGRKPLQVVGFLGMASFLLAFSTYLSVTGTTLDIKTGALVIGPAFSPLLGIFLYGMFNFMEQAGPGSISASGMLGVELSPTRVRGEVQSFTVAAGRIGASISSFIFPSLMATYGISFAITFLSILMFTAAIITLLVIPETRSKPLEVSSGELETIEGEKNKA
ncbi:MFS transporter [Sulfuracidifex metallicus]|uniref:MFS transporter n=1 Tax=Sulfuracidifex metallicus TaxID=47303 RepID=UPI0006D0B4E6|nr:MFS transporter [Sulfuracidifex metallicus]